MTYIPTPIPGESLTHYRARLAAAQAEAQSAQLENTIRNLSTTWDVNLAVLKVMLALKR